MANEGPAYLDLAGCAALLGVSRRALHKQLRAGGFAAPAGHDAEDPYWREDDVWTWWAAQGREQAASVRLDLWPDSETPAPFAGTGRWPVERGSDEVLLCWDTPGGPVGLLWRTEPMTSVPLTERVRVADLAVLVQVDNDLGVFGPSLSAAVLGRELAISQVLASYHLRKLAAAGFVELVEERIVRGGRERRHRYDPHSQRSI